MIPIKPGLSTRPLRQVDHADAAKLDLRRT